MTKRGLSRRKIRKYRVGLFFLTLAFTTILSLIFIVSSTYNGQLSLNHPAKPMVVDTAKYPPVVPSTFASVPSWSQNFATMPDGSLSTSVWGFNMGNGGPSNPGWGNGEQEYYTNSTSNARIEDGNLIIEALNQSIGGLDYTSARITTNPSLNFTYGELDIVAKIPSGVGTWPAIWLLPSDGKYALTTAAGEQDPNNWLRDGEVDIMEATGSLPGQISSSAQSYTYNPGNNNERVAVLNISSDATTFHDYELQWTPNSLTFLVDGKPYHTVTKSPTDTYLAWPYNQSLYLILNIAMGGTEGGTDVQQFPPYGIDNNSGPWEMRVKSINYYPYLGTDN